METGFCGPFFPWQHAATSFLKVEMMPRAPGMREELQSQVACVSSLPHLRDVGTSARHLTSLLPQLPHPSDADN